MLDVFARGWVSRILDPIGRRLARLGLTPTSVTVLGLAATVTGAVLVGAGRLSWGALVILAGGALDVLDGAIARASGRVSARGALVDSVADRLAETAMWSGLAFHLAGDPVGVLLCSVALGASLVISYLRSKAEALGLEGRGGWMGRSERVLLYVAGVGAGWVFPMLWAMVLLTSVTVVQRFRLVWGRLTG